jgi:hypothetical protein
VTNRQATKKPPGQQDTPAIDVDVYDAQVADEIELALFPRWGPRGIFLDDLTLSGASDESLHSGLHREPRWFRAQTLLPFSSSDRGRGNLRLEIFRVTQKFGHSDLMPR